MHSALLTSVRSAAAELRETDRRFADDLFDVIASGVENAGDDGLTEDTEEGCERILTTIGCNLADRFLEPRYGSSVDGIRNWFWAHGVSF